MGFWLGIASGMAQRQHEDELAKLQDESDRRKEMASAFLKIAQDPRTRPEGMTAMAQRALGILGTPLHKKLSKELEPSEDMMMVHPEFGGTVGQVPPAPEVPETKVSAGLPPVPGAPSEAVLPAIPPATMPMPSGQVPEAAPLPIYYTPQEEARMKLTQAADLSRLQEEIATRTAATAHAYRMEELQAQPAGSFYGTERDASQMGFPDLPTGRYLFTRNKAGHVTNYFPAEERIGATKVEWARDPESSTGWTMKMVRSDGVIPSVVRDLQPPASVAGTVTKTTRFIQSGDNWVEVPMETTHTPIGAPPAAPPAPSPSAPPSPPASLGQGPKGGRTLPRPTPQMPEATWERISAQRAALRNTADIVERVFQNTGVLDSLVSAGKIKLSVSPSTGALALSRVMNLTPQEEQFAADFQSLSEHINTLRGPLGATGFRGPEAFSALMGQRGNLLANPHITKGVLANTMKALLAQVGAITASTARADRTRNVIDPDTIRMYVIATVNAAHPQGDPVEAKRLALRDGWEMP